MLPGDPCIMKEERIFSPSLLFYLIFKFFI